MAFDWSKVEGYKEDLSADEKLALLDNYEAPAPEAPPQPEEKPSGNFVSKKRFDEVASELSKVKKELRGRMTADEAADLERQTKLNEMETELNELRHEKTVQSYRASYLAQGYDDKLADEAANAMADGDSDKLFAVMKKYNEGVEKTVKAKLMMDTPKPPASDDVSPKDDPVKKMEATIRKAMGLPPDD